MTNNSSCEKCRYRRNGSCPALRNELCSDYEELAVIDENTKKNWPSGMQGAYGPGSNNCWYTAL